MDLNLIGKHALVCGSSKGIGKACAIELAKLGANVTLVARNATLLVEVLSHLDKSQNQKHDYLLADFTNPTEVRKLVHTLVMQDPIDILINNTGGPAAGPAQLAETQAFEAAFTQHLLCNQVLVQTVLPHMKEKSWGRIINIISTSVKQPLENLGVSNTIRGAVASWAKTLSNELAALGITVNNVLPGATKTERLESIIQQNANTAHVSQAEVEQEMLRSIPMNRFAHPNEIAAAVAFLASPAAAYITGVSLPVDGGRIKGL